MIVSCEKCGKKYQINPEQIRGEAIQFQCKICHSVTKVSKQEKNSAKEPPSIPPISVTKGKAPPVSAPRKRGIGLRGKMFFLFFFVPICLIIAASLYYLNHMKSLSGLITQESSQVVTKMAEEAIAEKGRATAREVKLYLKTHPDLKKEDFYKDPGFMNVAIQPVGETGYTLLVSRATENEPSIIWAHPKKEFIGIDIVNAMKKTLGRDYERWYKIQGKDYEVGGYYMWIDKQEKYTFSVPIRGTIFNSVSTTNLGEFTLPMKHLEARANTLTARVTHAAMIILAVTALLIAFFVVFYSYRLSGRLKSLADAADHISLGNLNVEIGGIQSRDEIGDLANAFSRMQTSIRFAIKRLRERRQ